MTTKKTIIGFTASEIEAFYLKRYCPDKNFRCLVAEGDVNEDWVNQFLEKEEEVAYNLKPGIFIESSEYDEIFLNSNITEAIKKNGIEKMWLTTNVDNGRFLEAWSKKEKIFLLCTPLNQQRRLENKVWFDRFLKKYNLPKPESWIWRPGKRNIVFTGNLVIQEAFSSGGEGTFFIRSRKEFIDFSRKNSKNKKKYLVRKYVKGISLGITVLISSSEIYLSPVRLQCYKKTSSRQSNIFQGLQWLPSASLTLRQRQEINRVFGKMGRILNSIGHKGIVNFDFILSSEKVYLIECNPRLSSATPQIFQHPELLGLKDPSELIKHFFIDQKGSIIKEVHPIIKNSFFGSYLSLKAPFSGKLKKNLVSGTYVISKNQIHYLKADIFGKKISKNRFICHSSAAKTEKFQKDDEYGRIYSDFSLFTVQGKINTDGRKVINYFNKLCW